MKYKLLVCDFDGTLYTDDFKVAQETIDAVEEFKAAGGKFVIATGRLYQAVKPFAELFKLTDEIITYQGSGVFDFYAAHTGTAGRAFGGQPVKNPAGSGNSCLYYRKYYTHSVYSSLY